MAEQKAGLLQSRARSVSDGKAMCQDDAEYSRATASAPSISAWRMMGACGPSSTRRRGPAGVCGRPVSSFG